MENRGHLAKEEELDCRYSYLLLPLVRIPYEDLSRSCIHGPWLLLLPMTARTVVVLCGVAGVIVIPTYLGAHSRRAYEKRVI